jgi:hypothetical protein
MGSSPSCNLRVDELYGIGAHFAELMLNLMMAVGQFELKAAPRNQKKTEKMVQDMVIDNCRCHSSLFNLREYQTLLIPSFSKKRKCSMIY